MVEHNKFDDVVKNDNFELVKHHKNTRGGFTMVFQNKKTGAKLSFPNVKADNVPKDYFTKKTDQTGDQKQQTTSGTSAKDTVLKSTGDQSTATAEATTARLDRSDTASKTQTTGKRSAESEDTTKSTTTATEEPAAKRQKRDEEEEGAKSTSAPTTTTTTTPTSSATATASTVASSETHKDKILEMGHIYFFYRPRIQADEVSSLLDVQRLYILLKPFDQNKDLNDQLQAKHLNRLLVIGKKKLPDVDKHEPYWAYVSDVAPEVSEIVARRLESVSYDTESRASESVRPAGEGVYAFVDRPNSSILAYVLELPEEISEVQKAFNIEKEATYRISVKNPEGGESSYFGLDTKVQYPADLQNRFGDRKWLPLKPLHFLDYKNAEFLMIGDSHDIVKALGEEGEKLEEQKEKEMRGGELSVESIYKELKMKKSEHPIAPLKEGKWA